LSQAFYKELTSILREKWSNQICRIANVACAGDRLTRFEAATDVPECFDEVGTAG